MTAFALIRRYVEESDLPRKAAKLRGLAAAEYRRLPLQFVEDEGSALILLDGIAIDPSELENGHWL